MTARLAMPAGGGALGIVLAHGAGVGQDHPWMIGMRDRLAGRGLPTMTFNYAYTEAGRRSPDRPQRLLSVHAAAVARMRDYVDRVVLAGKSMGGRMASHLVGDQGLEAAGLVYYGYPLVPMGKGVPRATDHLERIAAPQLFLCGTRDRLSPPDLIRTVAGRLIAAEVVVIDGGDHSFVVPKRSARTIEDVLDQLADITARWIGDATAQRSSDDGGG